MKVKLEYLIKFWSKFKGVICNLVKNIFDSCIIFIIIWFSNYSEN